MNTELPSAALHSHKIRRSHWLIIARTSSSDLCAHRKCLHYKTAVIMHPPLIGGGIKRCFCLTSDICRSRSSGLSREQRGLGRPQLAQRLPTSHVTRWLVHHFQGQKITGQRHQTALLTATLTRKAGAAVNVRTYWAWETTATFCSRLRPDVRDRRTDVRRQTSIA